MGIEVAIRHHTKYIYDKAIQVWPQTIRLRPAPHSRTNIKGYTLKVKPENHFINWMQDPFGNYQARITFQDVIESFEIDVEVIAEMVAINPFDFFVEESAEVFPFEYEEVSKKELLPYLECNEDDSALLDLYDECKKYEDQKIVDFLVAINQHIYNLIDYSIRMEVGVQTCAETLDKKLGSCRDFAWLLVQLLRHFGLATRFVSGYLVQLTPDIKSKTGPSGPDNDFTDLHAWAEVYIPGAGWIGLDATSGLFASEGHIPLACTPHYESAAPVTGFTEKTTVQFEHKNEVFRVKEESRITKPYTPEEWERIKACGSQVDTILEKGDVRLTMGGEPTFISSTDMESAQWNSDADGEDKRQLAFQLATKLKGAFGKNGLIHFGQGKWYPGEPIPRWQYAIYWTKSGAPIWSPNVPIPNPNEKYKATHEDTIRFSNELTKYLGLDEKYITPAYEDEYYYMWEEHNLPLEIIKKEQSEKRKMILSVLEKGLDKPTGYVLPIRRNLLLETWESCQWELKRDKLFLIPGNSQMGYRLPLDRLVEKEVGDVVQANHFEGLPSLDNLDALSKKISTRYKKTKGDFDPFFKTALCIELIDGIIHVFMPPLDDMNHFLDMVKSIELATAELNLPVIIDGYQPPYHEAVTKLVVTPDPGVIEVNVHPATSWQELLNIYEVLFESADEIGLSTNKFMVDGRHTGTGGGNHITLGGVRPSESPILRRPDLLRSMLNFWQNHPSLSYLFSSPFIGPTSQAPRVDEGRPDAVYELEIAFAELERHENPPFWLVDRLFRNLLTDLTGNTHRAEFCIDKLYSPDSHTGRLGILELRGFDMPPHKEMCMVQLLLIRSLVAAFWKQPYKQKLINWRTDLHDKFMMHHFVKEDIHEVVDFINSQGIPFEKEWLKVFLDFRFPECGGLNIKGLELKLRSGIEPWIVLGEEMGSNGTARFVDSSVERLEVFLEDFNSERYTLLCNSVEVPLTKTNYNGKYVGAIRYKAWAPPSAMHPTIGVNSPLVFDVYDKWNNKSIGGCTYYVVHPGGTSYDTFPVNTLEAESRRISRFWEFNHTPKVKTELTLQNAATGSFSYITPHYLEKKNIEVKKVPVSYDFPHTLDLRRV